VVGIEKSSMDFFSLILLETVWPNVLVERERNARIKNIDKAGRYQGVTGYNSVT